MVAEPIADPPFLQTPRVRTELMVGLVPIVCLRGAAEPSDWKGAPDAVRRAQR